MVSRYFTDWKQNRELIRIKVYDGKRKSMMETKCDFRGLVKESELQPKTVTLSFYALLRFREIYQRSCSNHTKSILILKIIQPLKRLKSQRL